jgi:hypothetical protein
MNNLQFTKTVRSLAEARDIDLAYWYDQLGKQDDDETHCVEITVGLYKTKDFDRIHKRETAC